ncbi:MAG: hypothetical protein ACJ768_19530 [Gaiellaceae bacterium]
MRAVQKLIDDGRDPNKAIIAVLKARGTNVTQIAKKHGVIREELSRVINGRQVPTDPELDVLAAELGGTRAQWRRAWWTWNQPAELRQEALAGAR